MASIHLTWTDVKVKRKQSATLGLTNKRACPFYELADEKVKASLSQLQLTSLKANLLEAHPQDTAVLLYILASTEANCNKLNYG